MRRLLSALRSSAIFMLATPVWALAAAFPDKPLSLYTVNRWSPQNDFPVATAYSLVQSRDGFLWIGSTSGLFRFDGLHVVEYERGRYPQLGSNRIRVLFEGAEGSLWIGSEGGGLSRLARGKITTLTSAQGLPSDYIRAIDEGRDGTLWVGTDGEGICAVRGDSIIPYGRDRKIDGRVTSLLADSDGAVWVGTYGGLFRQQEGKWTRFSISNGLSSDSILCLHKADGVLWIGTFGGGLSILRNGVFSTFGRREGLPGSVVTCITGDSSAGVWVTTLRGGISRIWHGQVSSLTIEGHDRAAYPMSLLRDREGGVWIGLQNEGLVHLQDSPFVWYPTDEWTKPNPARSVLEDHAGRIWVGTANGLRFLESDGKLGKITAHEPPADLLSLAEDGHGGLWVGTLGHGLYRYHGGIFTKVPLKQMGTIWALYTDRHGAIWAGSNSGLARFQGGQTKIYTHMTHGLSHDDVRAICEGRNGSLWVGTSYGLDRLTQDTITVFARKNSRLSNDVIVALHEDEHGDLWVGTLGGLNRYRNGEFFPFTTADGLPEDVAGMILEDDREGLWIGGDRSLYRVPIEQLNDYAAGKIRKLRPTSFGKEDGLIDSQVSGSIQPAGWKSRDGRLWFTGMGGVAVADPEHLVRDTLLARPTIERLVADETIMTLDTLQTLSYAVHNFEIDYTVPELSRPHRVTYRYRLEGLPDDWINAGSRRTAYFTHIPPGRYLFRVVASRGDGIGSNPGSTLMIKILPPFWMTWWFHSALMIGVFATGYSVYRRHAARVKRENEARLMSARQILKGQEDERKRIAAELHDSLGQSLIVIKNRALLGKEASRDAREVTDQLDEIARTASTTLDDVRRIAHNLRPANLERFGLTEAVHAMIESTTSSSVVDFQTHIDDLDGAFTQENEIHFYRVLQEAINNVLRHSGTRSAVVRVDRDENGIRCVVEDHGKGFEPSSIVHGLGLSNITERTKILGGRYALHSQVGRGTWIELTFPAREKHGA